MIRTRIIPTLLLKGKGLVKTTQFKNPVYLGDPLNTINIFNKKMVDEIILLDIEATKNNIINFDLIKRIASICFSPLTYGGGITKIDEAEKIFNIGIEKISLNTTAMLNSKIISDLAIRFGSQSIIVSINVKKDLFGRFHIVNNNLKEITGPSNFLNKIKEFESLGAGEILINDVSLEGTMKGLDERLINSIASALNVPLIACGGARDLDDIKTIIQNTTVSAVGVGSLFVFNGPHKAVLISYPNRKKLREILNTPRNGI